MDSVQLNGLESKGLEYLTANDSSESKTKAS